MADAIPVEFIRLRRERLKKELEYIIMYDEDDRKEWFALSKKVDALDELIKDWRRYESKSI